MRDPQAGLFAQTGILFQRNAELFLNDRKRVAITLVLPILIGLVITIVTNKDDMGRLYETTRSTLFTIICAGIYVGIFNSLPLICKERQIVKREYMTGMKITSYILAMTAFQAIVSIVQALIFMIIYWGAPGIELPADTDVMAGAFGGYLITLFLVMFASDMMGMLISSIVRSNELANLIAPIIIIFQLVMSGVLFKLTGSMQAVAACTVSKWGMNALGVLAGLDGMKTVASDAMDDLVDKTPGLELPDEMIHPEGMDAYEATAQNLHHAWLCMIVISVVMIVLSIVFLRRVEKDAR